MNSFLSQAHGGTPSGDAAFALGQVLKRVDGSMPRGDALLKTAAALVKLLHCKVETIAWSPATALSALCGCAEGREAIWRACPKVDDRLLVLRRAAQVLVFARPACLCLFVDARCTCPLADQGCTCACFCLSDLLPPISS